MQVTQDQLYQEFLAETKPLKDEFDFKIKQLELELHEFRAPYDKVFAEKTSHKKELLLPELNEIESQHRYACHKIAVRAHRAIDKLEKKRLKLLEPSQAKWEEMTEVESKELDSIIEPKIKAHNELIEKLVAEFNASNAPAHDLYLAKAKELELKLLNTPVVQEE